MSSLYVILLVAIALMLMGVSIFRATLVKTKADYLVAGRSLPAAVLVLTLLTSWIGAGSLFAGAENAYRNGFAALWQPAGGWFGLLLIYFIAPRARKFAQFTLPDMLEARYNQTARVLGTIAILFAYVGITSYQFKGGGNVLHLIFPDTVTPELGTYLIAIFVIVSTAGRNVVGGLYGCSDRLAGDGDLHHRRANAFLQGRRVGRTACRAA
jgi:SSS family solute:Na+ symporter